MPIILDLERITNSQKCTSCTDFDSSKIEKIASITYLKCKTEKKNSQWAFLDETRIAENAVKFSYLSRKMIEKITLTTPFLTV